MKRRTKSRIAAATAVLAAFAAVAIGGLLIYSRLAVRDGPVAGWRHARFHRNR